MTDKVCSEWIRHLGPNQSLIKSSLLFQQKWKVLNHGISPWLGRRILNEIIARYGQLVVLLTSAASLVEHMFSHFRNNISQPCTPKHHHHDTVQSLAVISGRNITITCIILHQHEHRMIWISFKTKWCNVYKYNTTTTERVFLTNSC